MRRMSEPTLTDFPKILCPFIRKTFQVDVDAWKKHGARLQLRQPNAYLVVEQVMPDYEWVFDDKHTIAIEKLDGTNVKLKTEKGRLIAVQNRKNVIDLLQVVKGNTAIIEGVFNAISKGLVEMDGEQAGEVIGPKLQGNPYKLLGHEWIPFTTMVERLQYRSFHEHDRTFDNWSSWFKDFLPSRLFTKRARKLGLEETVMAEGVVFYNLQRKAEHKTWRAKLRRDMFPWFYQPDITILDYDQAGVGGVSALQPPSERHAVGAEVHESSDSK